MVTMDASFPAEHGSAGLLRQACVAPLPGAVEKQGKSTALVKGYGHLI
jgi:hypothetical protein